MGFVPLPNLQTTVICYRLMVIGIRISEAAIESPRIQHPASSIHHPPSSIQYPASTIEHPVSSIEHRASSIQYPASSIQHPASSIQYPASSIEHPVSSIQYRASSIQHPASSIQYLSHIIILQTFITDRLVVLGFEAAHDGLGRRQGGDKRNLVDNGRPTDGVFIGP